jgi:hypothetical protein
LSAKKAVEMGGSSPRALHCSTSGGANGTAGATLARGPVRSG